MKSHDLTDAELMHAIGRRDSAAFEVLYDRYVRLVFRAPGSPWDS